MNPSSRSHEIQEIARQTYFPEEVVNRLYEDALQYLAAKASIKDYLHVLASKRVHQHLKDMRRTEEGDSLFLK